uniref:Protein krueppel n=1 Tax=Anopheles culicifacies TaxID=139723 RepID=A0A182M114_9DIPT
MDEKIASAKEINLFEVNSFCRLCLNSFDEQTVLFSSPTVDTLFARIHQCTGVQLKDFPETCSRVCDGCISQLVICEKFVKQCREVDQKLSQLHQHYGGAPEATGENECFIPAKEHDNEEDVPKAKVHHAQPNLANTACSTPSNGKRNGDEFYVVEIVDANHEYEIDHYSENIPGELTHTEERKFQCEVCEETFKYKCSLVVHMRAHTQDKRYSCSECQKSFITSSGLKKHVRTHTGERPYKCTDCGKAFKASHNLSLHRLSHTKERRFQCDLCASWFSYKNVLKTHMNVHLREGKVHRKQDTAQKIEKRNRKK